MIIVKLKGGIGTQMFQYAFGRALSARRKELLVLDTSIFGNESRIDTPRHYALGEYSINALVAPEEIIAPYKTKSAVFWQKIKRRLIRLNDFKYYSTLANSRSTFFEGYWNNEKYFSPISEIIRHDFNLKEPLGSEAEKVAYQLVKSREDIDQKTPDKITFDPTRKNAVSIHIRRGDYISNPYARAEHNVITIDYYHKALEYMMGKIPKENLKLYVFSDDIKWVKEHLNLKEFDVHYISGRQDHIKDYEEIHLMSLCDHHIIANSSFSWWGAWLNRSQVKIVVAPKQWVKNPYINTNDVCPPGWVRI